MVEGNLNICLSNKCDILQITECTSTPDGCPINENGWTPDPHGNANLEKVYIEIYDVSGNLLDIIWIKDNATGINLFPVSLSGSFELPEYSWSFPDGYYKFRYVLEDNESHTFILGNFEQFFYCNAQHCVDSLWNDVHTTCDTDFKYKDFYGTKLAFKYIKLRLFLKDLPY